MFIHHAPSQPFNNTDDSDTTSAINNEVITLDLRIAPAHFGWFKKLLAHLWSSHLILIEQDSYFIFRVATF